MKALKALWRTIKDWWPLVLAIGAGALYLLTARPGSVRREKVELEAEIIRQKKRARVLEIQHGTKATIRAIKAKHAKTIRALDVQERGRVVDLERDPAELTAALLRLGAKGE